MLQQDKFYKYINNLVQDLFSNKECNSKIKSISSSFKIMYQVKGSSKFMQNMLCITPNIVHSRMHKLKAIIDKNLINQLDLKEEEFVILQDLNKNKIKKQYSIAVVDPKKIDKQYKNILTRKALLDNKIEDKESLINFFKHIQEDKCTKLIQTNNTISCKLGNFDQGEEIIKENLYHIVQFLHNKNIIIKTIHLLLHNDKKSKINIYKTK